MIDAAGAVSLFERFCCGREASASKNPGGARAMGPWLQQRATPHRTGSSTSSSFVATAAEPPSAIEIADRLKLPITTTHRGIHTLEQSGYIAQHPMSSRYVLANNTKRLTKALLARFAIRGASLHYLRYVAGASQETTTLTVPLGWYALTVATVLGINEVVDPAPVGSSVELHNSASGLAVLAFLPKAKIERYLAWVQKTQAWTHPRNPGSPRGDPGAGLRPVGPRPR